MQATADQPGIDVEELQGRNWQDVLDRFTHDMDPWSIDILTLADRFREYIETLDERNLEIPARMIFVCAALLRMKVDLMQDAQQEEDETRDFEEQDFEDSEGWERSLRIPEQTLEPPVQNHPKRRVGLDELKDALEQAMDIKQRRAKRQLERREDEFIDIEEDDISDKLDQLMDRLEGFFQDQGGVSFEDVLERRDREERIEKFIHLLHLETDEKIQCKQEEFFGDLTIHPAE
ncbi:MAG: segregation/condensation protein A [Candidatus Nanohaloarchaea archaeon]|nr:segregation/condensation protein A [Candidatus Nanohaloarchaea archaeon]